MKTILLTLLVLGAAASAPALETPMPDASPAIPPAATENDYPSCRKLLENPPDGISDVRLAEIFTRALILLSSMNEPQEFDRLLQLAETRYRTNLPLLLALYDSAGRIPSWGHRIGGEFVRGRNRGDYGVRFSCSERDRVRLLRLYDAAFRRSPDTLPGGFYARFAGLWLTGRTGGSSWELQWKTDLSVLPDYDTGNGIRQGSPPVGRNGLPVFYPTPKSWESAASDGERFQFLRRKAREQKETFADAIYADFLYDQFGRIGLNRWDISGEERRLLESLSDEETLVLLPDGPLRFRMPEGHNFIMLYRELGEWEKLGSIYLSRFQADRALEAFRKSGNREMVAQLSGNLGALDPLRVQTAGEEPVLSFLYRNAEAGNVTIRRIEEKALFDALLAAHGKNGKNNFPNLYSVPVKEVLEHYAGTVGAEIATFPLQLHPRPRHAETEQKITLPLKESGAYLVEIKLREGNTSRIIVYLTEAMLSVSNTTDQPGRLFLNHAVTGAPLPGHPIQVRFFRTRYARTPEELKRSGRFRIETKDFSGVTGKDGTLALPQTENSLYSFLAWTWINGKPVFCTGRNEWTGAEQRFPSILQAFMITGRPLYKPGDKVEFSGFLRRASYDGNSKKDTLPASVKIKVLTPRGETLFQSAMPVSRATGAFAGVFRLPEDAMLGNYRIVCERHGSVAFRTEEYKKPEYELRITLPDGPVRTGEMVTATLHADYYFGAPVPEADVTCRVYREIAVRPLPLFSRFAWLYRKDAVFPAGGRELVAEFSGKTGDDGTFPVRFSTAVPKSPGEENFRFRIEAEVSDSSRKVISASASLLAASKPFRVYLRSEGFCRAPDGITRLRIAALDPEGKPVEGAGLLRIYRTVLSPEFRYGNSGEAIRTIRFRSGENPSFVLNKAGVYRAVAEFNAGDRGKETAECIFRVLESNGESGMFSELPIELSLDKPSYRPGETARILISSNRPDADVYLFLDGTLKHLKLDGYSALVSRPVAEKDQPNRFVAALTFRNGTAFRTETQIEVPPGQRMLNVQLDLPEKNVRPRSVVPVDLTVTGADGKPVAGVFALTVYDKALEALAGSNIPSILSFFWDWKRYFYLYVRSGTDTVSFPDYSDGAMIRLSPVLPLPAAMNFDGMAWTKKSSRALFEKSKGESAPRETPRIRSKFADSIFWIGQRKLGADGRVRILVPVPDNLTTWVVRAWSIGPGTSVGEGRAELIVSKEITARLQIPPVLTEGDRVEALAIVHNHSAETVRAAIALTLSGDAASVQAPEETTRKIRSGESVTLPFLLHAEKSGELSPLLSVSVNGQVADAVTIPLSIRPCGIRKFIPAAGRLRNQIARVEYFVPESGRGNAEMTVTIHPGAATSVADLLPILAAEPSADLFSTVTRFLPALKALRAFSDLRISPDLLFRGGPRESGALHASRKAGEKLPDSPEAFRKQIRTNLQMLQGMVNSDGGWGWFSGWGEQSHIDTTAVAVDALLDAKAAQQSVDERILRNGIRWLKRKAEQRAAELRSGGEISNEDALLLRTLKKANAVSPDLQQLVFRQREKLSPFGLALLGLAEEDGSTAQTTVIRELERLLKTDPQSGTAYLNIPPVWRYSWAGSETSAQAAYLELLLRTAPNGERTEAVARYLTILLRNAPSRTSRRALGEAVGVLSQYLRLAGESDPDLNIMVKLDEGHIRSFRITGANLWSGPFQVTIDPEMLYPGRHVLELSCAGRGAIFYQTMLSCFQTSPRIGASGTELQLDRRYYRIDRTEKNTSVPTSAASLRTVRSETEHRTALADLATVRPGDIVEVELIPRAASDCDYVEFRDSLPAGFEYVKPQSGVLSWHPMIYAEFFEDGPSFHLRNLPRGASSIRYRIRARFAGSSTALPATGSGVYAPELRANSSDTRITIQEDQ